MPCLAKIQGIKMCVYSNDHVPPHIHALFGEYEILIAIREVLVLKGDMPNNKTRIALAYVGDNQEELLDAFYQLNPHIAVL
jgi:Domain of unknown function (DUF4160)